MQFLEWLGHAPLLCNDRLYGADSAETVEVPQVQYSDWVVDVPAVAVHRQGWTSLCLAVTELVGFLAHFAPFSRSASFSSWGALDDEEFFVIEGSGGGADAGSFSQVSGHQSLPINAQCVWTDTSI